MNAITKGYQDVPMTRRRAQLLEEYASKLADMLEAAPNDKDLAEWVQSKVDRAAAAIQSAYHYLDQDDESDLEKAVGHKYTHRKRVGTDKKGRARYRYYYAEHQGGGISRAKFEAGSAFKLTWKGRRGHFHIDRVEGDQIFITHDSRPDMEPVPVQADELRALLTKQHSKAEQRHVEKRQREVEEIKRRAHRGGLGLALHRLRQAAAQAGVSLPEQYQRKPKKTRAKVAGTAREVETPRDHLTSTAQQIIEDANQEHGERHDEHQEITRFELGEHTHTKTGAKLFTAKQTERVERDEYFRRLEIAKKHGGRYERRYVGGFVFKNAEAARAFALEVEGAAQEAPETSAETVTPHDEHPGADNFETMPEVESAPRSKAAFREKAEELKRLEEELIDFTSSLARPQGLTKEQEKDILDKMQAEIAKKRDELTEGFTRPQSSGELEARLKSFLPKLKGLDYSRAEGYRLYIDKEHKAPLRAQIKELMGTGLNVSPTNQKNYGLNVAGSFKEMVRLLFALENEAKGTPRGHLTPSRLYGMDHETVSWHDIVDATGQGDLSGRKLKDLDLSEIQTSIDFYASILESYRDDPKTYKRFRRQTDKQLRDLKRYVRTRKAEGRIKGERPPAPPESKPAPTPTVDLTQQEKRDALLSLMPTTPREQLTETAREVTQGADNFETMPEVEAPKSSARERELFNIVYDKTLDRKQAVKKRHRQAYLDLIEKRPIGGEERRALIELGREYTGILQQLINAVEIPGVSKGDTYAKLDAYAETKGIAYTDRRSSNYAEAAFRVVIQDILKSGPYLDERRTRADFVRHITQKIAAFEQAAQKQSAPSMEKVRAPAPPQAATTPTSGTVQRQSVLDAAEEAQRLDAQGGSKRSAAAIAADERLAETIRNLISNEYQGVEDVTRSDKPRRQWTVKERELNSLIDRLETLQSAKKRTRSMTAATAQNIRETTRGRLIDEMRRRIETDSRIKPTAPARQALTETAERVTSDQTAEQATTRATPRPSEETLRGSGELDETVRANLQDRAQYLLRMPEDTTKTGMRSKAQKARDGELLLIHRRLQSDAQERLGPTAPRFADYSQLVGMSRADQPENAETRAQFRTALKDAIRELEQATSGRAESAAPVPPKKISPQIRRDVNKISREISEDHDLLQGLLKNHPDRENEITTALKRLQHRAYTAIGDLGDTQRYIIERRLERARPQLIREVTELYRGGQTKEALARIVESVKEVIAPEATNTGNTAKERREAKKIISRLDAYSSALSSTIQKSAHPLITYRAQLIQTVERLTA